MPLRASHRPIQAFPTFSRVLARLPADSERLAYYDANVAQRHKPDSQMCMLVAEAAVNSAGSRCTLRDRLAALGSPGEGPAYTRISRVCRVLNSHPGPWLFSPVKLWNAALYACIAGGRSDLVPALKAEMERHRVDPDAETCYWFFQHTLSRNAVIPLKDTLLYFKDSLNVHDRPSSMFQDSMALWNRILYSQNPGASLVTGHAAHVVKACTQEYGDLEMSEFLDQGQLRLYLLAKLACSHWTQAQVREKLTSSHRVVVLFFLHLGHTPLARHFYSMLRGRIPTHLTESMIRACDKDAADDILAYYDGRVLSCKVAAGMVVRALLRTGQSCQAHRIVVTLAVQGNRDLVVSLASLFEDRKMPGCDLERPVNCGRFASAAVFIMDFWTRPQLEWTFEPGLTMQQRLDRFDEDVRGIKEADLAIQCIRKSLSSGKCRKDALEASFRELFCSL